MYIHLLCACGKKLKVSDTLAGKKVKCPDCDKINLVSVDDEENEACKAKMSKTPAADDHGEATVTDEEGDSPKSAKNKRHLRNKILIVLSLLVVGGGGVASYFYFRNVPYFDASQSIRKDDTSQKMALEPPPPPLKFESYESLPGRFTAKFWGRPLHSLDAGQPSGKKKTFYSNVYKVSYMVSYEDLPSLPDEAETQKWLTDFLEDFDPKSVSTPKDIELGRNKFPGKYVEITLGPVLRRLQRYVVNDRVYEIYVQGLRDRVATGQPDEFLKSFALKPEPAKKKVPQNR